LEPFANLQHTGLIGRTFRHQNGNMTDDDALVAGGATESTPDTNDFCRGQRSVVTMKKHEE
jgi:hypothetical protein